MKRSEFWSENVWNSLLIISVTAMNKSGCWPPAVVATADKDRFNIWFLASQPSVHLFYFVHELREGATPGCELTDPNMLEPMKIDVPSLDYYSFFH